MGLYGRFWLKRRKHAAVFVLYGRSSPLKPDQALGLSKPGNCAPSCRAAPRRAAPRR
ncbi:protein of unknown function (plasmid) [Azospirillum baldaniorum]|uniref:Uncharacterized protein n=1 Tax=Azospirillum baldaniorum TaxID=1064539 RepID=A0A9P1NRA1_9PROT|nr:protein of unknown function [Azospirillum baldaniorum]